MQFEIDKTVPKEDGANINTDSRPTMRLFGRHVGLPRSVLLRRVVGTCLIIMGIFGFLPVVGFWMIPLGLWVLSYDSKIIRRWRRKMSLWIERKRKNGAGNSSRR